MQLQTTQMPEVGERYLGTVVKLAAFGAFISLMPGKDGFAPRISDSQDAWWKAH